MKTNEWIEAQLEKFNKKFACKEQNCCDGKNLNEIRKKPLMDFLCSSLQEAMREREREILEIIDKNYLAYCREQNGRPDCKNCGLNMGEIRNLINTK